MKQLILSNCRSFWSTFVSIGEDMLFCTPLEITYRADDISKLSPRLLQKEYNFGKICWCLH